MGLISAFEQLPELCGLPAIDSMHDDRMLLDVEPLRRLPVEQTDSSALMNYATELFDGDYASKLSNWFGGNVVVSSHYAMCQSNCDTRDDSVYKDLVQSASAVVQKSLRSCVPDSCRSPCHVSFSGQVEFWFPAQNQTCHSWCKTSRGNITKPLRSILAPTPSGSVQGGSVDPCARSQVSQCHVHT